MIRLLVTNRTLKWTILVFMASTIPVAVDSSPYQLPNSQPPHQRLTQPIASEISDRKDTVTLYLTFDDGLIPESEALYDFVRTAQVPVTAFLIGQFVYKNDTTRHLWQQLRQNPWIEAGNHSFTHANSHFYKYTSAPTT